MKSRTGGPGNPNREGTDRLPVIRLLKPDDLIPSGECSCSIDGHLVGFGPAGGPATAVSGAGSAPVKSAAYSFLRGIGRPHGRICVLFDLEGQCLRYFRVILTEIGGVPTRGEINEFLSVLCPEMTALGPFRVKRPVEVDVVNDVILNHAPS